MYSYTPSSTSVLDGLGGQRHAPTTLTQGKTWYPLCKSLGGPYDSSRWVRKISPPPGYDPQIVQAIVSRYTQCAKPPPHTHTHTHTHGGHIIFIGKPNVDRRLGRPKIKFEGNIKMDLENMDCKAVARILLDYNRAIVIQ
jgi:hypothetical protein